MTNDSKLHDRYPETSANAANLAVKGKPPVTPIIANLNASELCHEPQSARPPDGKPQ
jgi:hypothetical protein